MLKNVRKNLKAAIPHSAKQILHEDKPTTKKISTYV